MTVIVRTARKHAVLSALDREQWRFVTQIAINAGFDPSSTSVVLRELLMHEYAERQEEDPAEADFGKEEGVLRNRARRRYYRLTSAGAALLDRWGAELDAATARRSRVPSEG